MEEAGTQEIQLSVTPMTASCEALQHGDVVGRLDPSRQSIVVPKRPGSTEILCFAPGYKDKRVSFVPDADFFGSLLVDFGPADLLAYPARVQIVMESAEIQGMTR
jgi:hypothetical protein